MKKYLIFILVLSVLVCKAALNGGSSETTKVNGGFIRETYSGFVEAQIIEDDSRYISVGVGNGEVIDFFFAGTTEIEGGEAVSVGDAVTIDCVHWYPSAYEILKLTITAHKNE